MPAAAIPLGIWLAAGSTAGSIAAAKIASNSADKQTELARQGLAQANAATGLLQGQAQNAIDRANPQLDAASKYYQTLLGGNRAAISQATAPTTSAIRDTFAGAKSGVEAGYARGGVRDLALANIDRDTASQVSRVYSGVQPAAAAALNDSGRALLGLGMQGYGAVPGAYNAQASTGLAVGQTQAGLSSQAGRDVGSFLFNTVRNKPAGQNKTGFAGLGYSGMNPSYQWGTQNLIPSNLPGFTSTPS